MSYLLFLFSLLVVDLLAAMSPGPNFVLVMHSSIHGKRLYAAAVVYGLAAANLIWCTAVALGLATLFGALPWLYGVIKIFGGAYLIFMGAQLWRSNKDAPLEIASLVDKSQGAGFVRGLLTNLTNPKSAIYFGSIFALFMKPDTPAWVQIMAIGIVLADTILWYGTVAVILSNAVAQRLYTGIRRPIDGMAGTLMVAFGARLILIRE